MWRRRVPAASGGVGPMEQDLLARFTGDSGEQRLQGHGCSMPPPSPALSLCLGSEEELPDHGRAPKRAQLVACPCTCPSTSCVPFAAPLVSIVVPGHPATAPLHPRPPDLPTGAGARPETSGPVCDRGALLPDASLPHRPSAAAAAAVPSLEPIYLTPPTTTAARGEQCRCDARSLCARLMQGLAGDLDRARAQVALLTCENESLRHRLKHAVAAAEAGSTETAPSTTRRLHAAGGLRCRACRARSATVVLTPREHLCLCARCSDACRHDPAIACWVCLAAAGQTGDPPAAPR